MKKRSKIALICVIAAIPLLLIAAFLLFALPYINAASSMPEGASLSLLYLSDGEYRLEWSAGDNATHYAVSLGDEAVTGEPVSETRTLLSGVAERDCTITVTPYGSWYLFGREHLREGEPLATSVSLVSPDAPEAEWTVDVERQTLTAVVEPRVGLSYELRLVTDDPDAEAGENERLLASSDDGTLTVRFGEDADLAMPEYGEEYAFVVRAVLSGEGYALTGRPGEAFTLEREDLLSDTSTLSSEAMEDTNQYSLSWTEAKGDYYEIQAKDGDEWTTLATVDCGEELVYETGTLASCREYTFRVVGYDEGVEESVSSSDELSFTTERSPIYCTIWPLTELAVYADSSMSELMEGYTAPAATAYCVMDEENGMFQVRLDEDVYGWIESNYCMINLPEYLGELLAYDITNSYASKYMVHGYEIPEVTDTVIPGYEHVQLADGLYLAPYLYPCCEKLYNAATAALEDGYRLKIYDSFRPRMATTYIYNTAEAIIDTPLPETDFYGEVPEDLPDEEGLTYRRLVTEGNYSLPNFLAQNGSYHNMGIALDLTLERVDTGEELEMQTDMHDLSVYSIISRNNEEALLLDSYMKAAGFGGLTSEWWHFQDNDTRNALSLNIYMQYGVSCAGWVCNDDGWRYRNADGTYAE